MSHNFSYIELAQKGLPRKEWQRVATLRAYWERWKVLYAEVTPEDIEDLPDWGGDVSIPAHYNPPAPAGDIAAEWKWEEAQSREHEKDMPSLRKRVEAVIEEARVTAEQREIRQRTRTEAREANEERQQKRRRELENKRKARSAKYEKCPHCGELVCLTSYGTLRSHPIGVTKENRCPGSWERLRVLVVVDEPAKLVPMVGRSRHSISIRISGAKNKEPCPRCGRSVGVVGGRVASHAHPEGGPCL